MRLLSHRAEQLYSVWTNRRDVTTVIEEAEPPREQPFSGWHTNFDTCLSPTTSSHLSSLTPFNITLIFPSSSLVATNKNAPYELTPTTLLYTFPPSLLASACFRAVLSARSLAVPMPATPSSWLSPSHGFLESPSMLPARK